MATSSLAKYDKYFSESDVKTHIKSASSRPIYAYSLDGHRLGEFQDGDSILVKHSPVYNPQYLVESERFGLVTVNENFVAKPINKSGPSETLRIQTDKLVSEGVLSLITIGTKESEFRTFNSANAILQSAISGLKSNWRISEHIVTQFEDYAKSSVRTEFEWNENIKQSERCELGKYLGEIIPGVLLMDSQGLEEIASSTEIVGFPTISSFSGIDSCFGNNVHEVSFISSKFGRGARSSVFSNLIPDGIRNYNSLQESEFKTLIDKIQEYGITSETLEAKRGSKEALYAYGISHILGMNVKSPVSIFNNLRSHIVAGESLNSETVDVLNKVKSIAEDCIKEKLPGSLTQFFAREAAKRLNADSKAIEDMKSVLSMKDYYQLNLNMPKWHRGIIDFKVSKASECNLKILGNKSPIGAIDARQGTLSYEIS